MLIKEDYKDVLRLERDDERAEGISEVFSYIRHDNIWIEFFLSKQQIENKGWIDFEREVSSIIQTLDYMRKYRKEKPFTIDYRECPDKFDIEQEIFTKIDKTLREDTIDDDTYRFKIIDRLKEDLECLIRCLEIYLSDWVNLVPIKLISPDIQAIKVDKLLSFNYTNTFERTYEYVREHNFIHGQAEADRHMVHNNMILGIDEYLIGEAKNTEVEFIEFKKYFQRIYKKTGCEYKSWACEMQEEDKEKSIQLATEEPWLSENEIIENIPKHKLFIFGHSLDVTDKDILKEMILYRNIETTIFYLNKQVYAQQIANLVKVIGQDELIKRVSGPNATIIFKQQQEMRPKV